MIINKSKFRKVSQEHYFPIIVGIHLIFWAIDLTLYTGDYEFTVKHVAGEIFASWVVTVFAFNFIMITRARWVERIFGGLDKMYIIHRRSGIIAIVLLTLHFIVIPMDPRFSIGKPMGILSYALILIGVILAAVPLFKILLPYNSWRIGHKLMGVAYVIGVAHSFNVPTLTSELPIVKTYVYGMSMIGIFAWVYKAFLYRLFNRRLPYIVDSLKRFENDIIEISLKPLQKQLEYKPGQFAFFSFDGIGTKEAHPYTISSHPSDKNLRITVKAMGDYTADLQTELQEGMKAYVEGAFGHFSYKNARYKKQIWLAGGIGITPFLPILKNVEEEYDVTFIWSVRPQGASNYQDEINIQSQQKPNLETIIHDSESRGHFSIRSKFKSVELKGHSIFICGPKTMLENHIKQLLEKGVSIRDIHYEEFLFR